MLEPLAPGPQRRVAWPGRTYTKKVNPHEDMNANHYHYR